MSKILNAQRNLKADKKNKFTSIYNAAPNAGLTEETPNTQDFKAPVGNPIPAAPERVALHTEQNDFNTYQDTPSPAQKSKLSPQIWFAIILLTLIAINLRIFALGKNNQHSVNNLSEKLNRLEFNITDLQKSVDSLMSQLSTNMTSMEKFNETSTREMAQHESQIQRISQNLNAFENDFVNLSSKIKQMDLALVEVSDDSLRTQDRMTGIQNELSNLMTRQNQIRTQLENFIGNPIAASVQTK